MSFVSRFLHFSGRTCADPLLWRCNRGVGAPSSGRRGFDRACRGIRSGRGQFRARRAPRT